MKSDLNFDSVEKITKKNKFGNESVHVEKLLQNRTYLTEFSTKQPVAPVDRNCDFFGCKYEIEIKIEMLIGFSHFYPFFLLDSSMNG